MPTTLTRPTATVHERASGAADPVMTARDVSIFYGTHRAVRDVDLDVPERSITAIIGPSGCGKSTFLRSLNRMNETVADCRVEGDVRYHGVDIHGAGVDPVEVRRRIGMVFQKPAPFATSIRRNVAYGLRLAGVRHDLDDRVEHALRGAALWDEVAHRLDDPASGLSGGQQQRLCIARALAVEPDVLLMDEPCSALDPIATARIEELMGELASTITIVIVTHNMAQAGRVSDRTAFFTTEVDVSGARTGVLVETGPTATLFANPTDERTEQYVSGRFG